MIHPRCNLLHPWICFEDDFIVGKSGKDITNLSNKVKKLVPAFKMVTCKLFAKSQWLSAFMERSKITNLK